LNVTATGVTQLDVTESLISKFNTKIVYSNGRVYASDGAVVNAEARTLAGTLSLSSGIQRIAVDPTGSLVYNVPWNWESLGIAGPGLPLAVYSTTSFAKVDQFSVFGGNGTVTSMITWGPQGVAIASKSSSAASGPSQIIIGSTAKLRGAAGEYHPVAPTRIVDTRSGLGRGGVPGKIGAGQVIVAKVTGVGGVLATGVESVVLNVTATNPTSPSFLSLWPSGEPQPGVSNLNFTSGQTVPNLVTVPVGDDGAVAVYNERGATDVIFDIAGYYSDFGGTRGDRFRALTPSRVLDTRSGTGRPAGSVGTSSFNLQVSGVGGVPAAGATAVVMNVTVTNPTAGSYLTIYPDGQALPNVSNLNYLATQTVPNLVIVQLPANGKISFANAFGRTDVIADVVGYYTGDRSNESGRFVSFPPFRWFDSRVDTSVFGGNGKLGNGDALELGTSTTWVSAYAFNATVTAPEGGGFVTAYPSSSTLPNSSNVNYVTNQTVPNHVIVGASPKVVFEVTGGTTHLIVDVFGAFT
jgi:hypothetical protein